MPSIKKPSGSPPRKLAPSDGIDISKRAVIAAAAALSGYIIAKIAPDTPEEIKAAAFVCGYALLQAAVDFFSDTRKG